MELDIFFLLVLLSSAVVPGELFSTDSYTKDTYFNHHIDLSLERLNSISKPITVFLDIVNPKDYNFQLPVKGEMTFYGLRTLKRLPKDNAETKRHSNDDVDLLGKFSLGKINGTGNFSFSGQNAQTPYNIMFNFVASASKVEAFFLLTKDEHRKRMSFQFLSQPSYKYESRSDVAVSRLLKENVPMALNVLFESLYDLLYTRIVSRQFTYEPLYDEFFDKNFQRWDGHKKIYKTYYAVNQVSYLVNHAKPDEVFSVMNMTIDGVTALRKTSQVQFQLESKNALNLRTTIQFGNLFGSAVVSGHSSNQTDNKTFEDTFTFNSPPAEVNATFYLPRNASCIDVTFHFRTKPNFKVDFRRQDLKHNIQKVVTYHCSSIYRKLLDQVLSALHRKLW